MSDWRVERHDEEIRRLEKRLYAAEDKIRTQVAPFWIYEIVSKNH